MRLCKLTLTGFRCFAQATSIEFSDLTAIVGANGVGKSAILMALVRMFGTTNSQRALAKEDFHIALGEPSPAAMSLCLDAIFEFPELLGDDSAAASGAIPECLRHISITPDNETPRCRILLKATWHASASVDGDIEQRLVWSNSDADVPSDEDLHGLTTVERSLIQVFYVPARRDAARELRTVSGTILSRALQAVAWSDPVREAVKKGTDSLTETLRGEPSMLALENTLSEHWRTLSDHQATPFFALAESDLSSVLRSLDARLKRADDSEETLALLSEGERSLMYFALLRSALEFEQQAAATGSIPAPVLTILAVEEPENHLAPHYLGRILASLRGVLETKRAQVLLTSHSASLMRRIDPAEIRHLRVEGPGVHHVSALELPAEADSAFKYVREAVRAHPELYFAKAVVLCEGASEEVILPRMAKVHGLDIDPRFVAVIPLGGRHVHHFWRLLRCLRIPFVTLLDLDLERLGGGWGRIHYAMTQLIAAKESESAVLAGMAAATFTKLPKEPHPAHDDGRLLKQVDELEKFGVFFSTPLDVDLMMMRVFPSQYRSTVGPNGRGPTLPTAPDKLEKRLKNAARAVLGDEGGDGNAYPADAKALFPWYSYFFIGGSKPATHAAALAEIEDAAVLSSCPPVFVRLVDRVKSSIEV